MSSSKIVNFVFIFFFSFACSTASSHFNTSLTPHKYKCPAQQYRALLLFKHNLSSISNSLIPLRYNLSSTNYSPCKNWLGDEGYYPIMKNWNTNTDCCDWNGVTCDYLSGNVIGLDLSCGMLKGIILPNSTIFNLPHLERLNLAFNDFSGSKIPSEIGRFSKSFTHLNVSYSGFFGKVPTNITLLRNLVSLDLSRNDFTLEPHVFVNVLTNYTRLKELWLTECNISSPFPSNLNISYSSLELLDLRETRLHGKLPRYIFNIQSLKILDLSFNRFTGQIPLETPLLPKLVSLDISINPVSLERDAFGRFISNSTLLRDLSLRGINISGVSSANPIISFPSSLKYLDLGFCSLTGSLAKSPHNLTDLTFLDVSHNKLNGTLPSWLFTLPSLEYLSLDGNMFSGDVPFNSFSFPPLKYLYLSNNQLSGQIDQDIIVKFTNLTLLHIYNNNFSSNWDLDKLLSSLTNLENLALSDCGLSITTSNSTHHHTNLTLRSLYLASCKLKEFPLSIRYMRNLGDLDLSNNEINGDIPIWVGGDNQLYGLNLSYNLITGVSQFQMDGVRYLSLQSNKIKGPFPLSICNTDMLFYLNLSNNSFGGVIPRCFGNLISYTSMIDLANNDFHGTIPNTIEDCRNLKGLILKGNKLQGELPTSFSKCKFLAVIDLENNLLNSTFPDWLGGLSELQVLNLKSNMFHGHIATSSAVEFPFSKLQVLDLSHNRFVGQLPAKYFQYFNALKRVVTNSTGPEYLRFGIEYYSITLTIKGVVQAFPRLLVEYTVVDVSNNNFEGKIPAIIGELVSLKALNLSHNSLNGEIPHALGNLSGIESLDLSSNQLTGDIPTSLVDINGLAVLNLSRNHLIGRIPQGKQFNTFNAESFAGNPGLCGVPLPNHCELPQDNKDVVDEGEHDDESGFTWKAVMLGYGCGTLLGMLIMGYLMLSTRTPKWFTAISDALEHTLLKKQNKRRYVYIGR